VSDVEVDEVRSRIVASVKGKDTKPELVVRRYLHRLGFRYGLHAKLAKLPDIDAETSAPSEVERAGVTVVCNDRVVVLRDRTAKTGWGDNGVPRYHSQFRAIAGLISFTCNDASKLPVSTTKRNLETTSEVYVAARGAAMEGFKLFTDFTNKWRGMEADLQKFFDDAEKSEIHREIDLARNSGRRPRGGSEGTKKFTPSLPEPKNLNPRVRISYLRDRADVIMVSRFLFDGVSEELPIVGGECFDRFLKNAKR